MFVHVHAVHVVFGTLEITFVCFSCYDSGFSEFWFLKVSWNLEHLFEFRLNCFFSAFCLIYKLFSSVTSQPCVRIGSNERLFIVRWSWPERGTQPVVCGFWPGSGTPNWSYWKSLALRGPKLKRQMPTWCMLSPCPFSVGRITPRNKSLLIYVFLFANVCIE